LQKNKNGFLQNGINEKVDIYSNSKLCFIFLKNEKIVFSIYTFFRWKFAKKMSKKVNTLILKNGFSLLLLHISFKKMVFYNFSSFFVNKK